MAAAAYGQEPSVLGGVNVRNFMSTNDVLVGQNQYLFKSGIIRNGDLSQVEEIDPYKIEEDVTHSWYNAQHPQHPLDGTTIPEHTPFVERETVFGTLPTVDGEGKYSWVKSPRYAGEPVEVGPLAAVLVNYGRGVPEVVEIVDAFLARTGLPKAALFTTLGRTAARMLHTLVQARHGNRTFEALENNIQSDTSTYIAPDLNANVEYKGFAMIEAPRGLLSHWIRIKGGLVENYQAVVPTTWNAGPRDGNGKVGPYEASLVGLKLDDPTKPLEILRVIHSFDPCMACSVHVMDYKGQSLSQFRIDPNAF
ncbi:quinone-reactive Ni/Fe-hydrogenase large chain [Photobacterium aphoticum]|uniref:Uptake hydrogenase large subunit n=1 Tax=Photobacterium aphoticum TaxID=754436 RepID=A0A090QWM5_9GAMM|nr:quinone-reactive Ni/Fe-hydrogenase large chain [Photobacterium aphoticum]